MQINLIRGYATNPQLSWAVDNTIGGGSYQNTLRGATTFIACNRAHGTESDKVYYRHILVFDSTKTTLKQLFPVTSRSSIIMKKSPTDVISVTDMYPINRVTKTFAIGGEADIGILHTTVHPVDAGCNYPMLVQNPGDCYVGFVNGVNNGSSNAGSEGQIVPNGSVGQAVEPCDPQFAHSLNRATIVHAANCEKSKAHIQIVDADDNPVGNLQLPRGASVKFRKKATDKVYASETLSGGGNFTNCNVVFSKIGYSN